MIDPDDTPVIGPKPEPPGSAPAALSAQDQMERFEEDLKENVWGHQPCKQ
jgi:hypothetical protein